MKTLQNFYTVFLSVRVKCMNLAAVVNVRIVCYIYVRCAKRAIKKNDHFSTVVLLVILLCVSSF